MEVEKQDKAGENNEQESLLEQSVGILTTETTETSASSEEYVAETGARYFEINSE